METKVSSKGQVVLPASFRRKLDLREGDPLDVRIDGASIVLTPRRKRAGQATIVTSPLSGLPALKAPEGAPILRSKDVREMLADFP
jgi:AbrB family looped-hinge helix DNA binding protein